MMLPLSGSIIFALATTTVHAKRYLLTTHADESKSPGKGCLSSAYQGIQSAQGKDRLGVAEKHLGHRRSKHRRLKDTPLGLTYKSCPVFVLAGGVIFFGVAISLAQTERPNRPNTPAKPR
jgi:hypothetical protein